MDEMRSLTSQFDKLTKKIQQLEAKTKKGIEKDMYKACLKVKSEAQGVIRDYNRGSLERFEGDYAGRAARGSTNNPLIDTGFFVSNISIEVSKDGNTTRGEVIFGADYAKYLNDGTENIKAYRFKEIAMVLSEDAVKKILKIEV